VLEHLPPEGVQCDRCATGFKDQDELARHKQSHEASGTEDAGARSDNPDARNQGLQGSQEDNQKATTAGIADGSNEEARAERDVVEGQLNDRTNDLSNRANIDDYRDDAEWEVNPDQTPKQAKTIRPIPYV
jgi:hypothetical protein